MENKVLERCKKRFIVLCNCTAREYIISDEDNEYNIDKWTIRDFVSEGQYQADMRESDIHDSYDRQEYNLWKRFAKTYSKYLTDDIKCYMTHDSDYDLI